MTALVRDYGIICISRPGSNAARLLYEMDLLSRYEVSPVGLTPTFPHTCILFIARTFVDVSKSLSLSSLLVARIDVDFH